MIPNATLLKVISGEIDYSSDDIGVGLLDDSQAYVADPDTHEFVEDFPPATNGQDVNIQWDSEDGIQTLELSSA